MDVRLRNQLLHWFGKLLVCRTIARRMSDARLGTAPRLNALGPAKNSACHLASRTFDRYYHKRRLGRLIRVDWKLALWLKACVCSAAASNYILAVGPSSLMLRQSCTPCAREGLQHRLCDILYVVAPLFAWHVIGHGVSSMCHPRATQGTGRLETAAIERNGRASDGATSDARMGECGSTRNMSAIKETTIRLCTICASVGQRSFGTVTLRTCRSFLVRVRLRFDRPLCAWFLFEFMLVCGTVNCIRRWVCSNQFVSILACFMPCGYEVHGSFGLLRERLLIQNRGFVSQFCRRSISRMSTAPQVAICGQYPCRLKGGRRELVKIGLVSFSALQDCHFNGSFNRSQQKKTTCRHCMDMLGTTSPVCVRTI